MKRKAVLIILILFFASLGIFRIVQTIQKHRFSKQLHEKDTKFTYVVKVKPAEYKKIVDSINFVGEVKGINEVTVIPKVTGRLVKKIKEEGSIVKKEEVICEIDRDEPVLRYTLYELRSPVDGVVGRYFVDIGGMVSPQTPVCIISDIHKVRVIFNIAESMVDKLNKNSYTKIETETGKIFISKSLQLSNYIDPISRTMEVRVILDNPDNILKSGSFVKGELVFNEKFAVVVPIESVFEIDNKKIVFVINNGIVEERNVKVGLKYKNYIEILSGVKEDEKVVYQGGELLVDGMKVEVVN
ncbi:MAG: efflux RND transporter periplasmic adaptor subunit [Endomicrobia bacterium]|nr:efflux RND transporter periplasmic adaptor subunit [Endomicrobiia bacterium]MCX7716019.1 efflux RND transporter periplasmic adaptor subunit [Endomicrobiia bacterium]